MLRIVFLLFAVFIMVSCEKSSKEESSHEKMALYLQNPIHKFENHAARPGAGANGEVSVKSEESKASIFFNSREIASYDDIPSIFIEKTYILPDADVHVIQLDYGGRNTYAYRLLVVKKDSSPFIGNEFSDPNGGEIYFPELPSDNSITIRTAVDDNNKVHIIEYRNGAVNEYDESPQKDIAAEDEHCDQLYRLFYIPFINAKKCELDVDSVAKSMNDLREYNYIISLESVAKDEFERLSVISCKSSNAMGYEEFKEKVCGGR